MQAGCSNLLAQVASCTALMFVRVAREYRTARETNCFTGFDTLGTRFRLPLLPRGAKSVRFFGNAQRIASYPSEVLMDGVCRRPHCRTHEARYFSEAVSPSVPLKRASFNGAFISTTLYSAPEWLANRAGIGERVHKGSVRLVQRLGPSLNLHVHLHTCALDGVFVEREGGVEYVAAALAGKRFTERACELRHERSCRSLGMRVRTITVRSVPPVSATVSGLAPVSTGRTGRPASAGCRRGTPDAELGRHQSPSQSQRLPRALAARNG